MTLTMLLISYQEILEELLEKHNSHSMIMIKLIVIDLLCTEYLVMTIGKISKAN